MQWWASNWWAANWFASNWWRIPAGGGSGNGGYGVRDLWREQQERMRQEAEEEWRRRHDEDDIAVILAAIEASGRGPCRADFRND